MLIDMRKEAIVPRGGGWGKVIFVVCLRCHGLMSQDICVDLEDEMGIFTFPILHCLNCGEIVDPLILQHRGKVPPPHIGRARVAPKTALTGSGAGN